MTSDAHSRDDPGVLVYRLLCVAYAFCLPGYFYYRFVHTIEGGYQWTVCVLELYGALNVLLLGLIRFRRPWASAIPTPPGSSEVASGRRASGEHEPFWAPMDGDDGSAVDAEADDGAWSGPFDVSILVPCCNEPDDVIFGTIRAALALAHPLARSVRVVLCDDGAKASRADRLGALGPPERVLYVSRPKDPRVPRHGKAGNLNHTLREVLYPSCPPAPNALVVILDCDMEAHGDFLAATLPYLATDRRTALVQTPQFFYNVVPQGDIFNHHNLTFYQAMQPGLDAWRATVCCGTNFVARASALHEVGWFPTESITEDFVLSVKLATMGYHVRASSLSSTAVTDCRLPSRADCCRLPSTAILLSNAVGCTGSPCSPLIECRRLHWIALFALDRARLRLLAGSLPCSRRLHR